MFDASCAVSIATVTTAFFVVSGMYSVSGWSLAAMVLVVLIAIAGIMHTHEKGRDGQAGKS